jgi:hypothetical protein
MKKAKARRAWCQVPEDVKVGVLVESYFLDNTSLADKDLEALSLKAADAVAEGIAEYLVANCKPRKRVIVEPKKAEPAKKIKLST